MDALAAPPQLQTPLIPLLIRLVELQHPRSQYLARLQILWLPLWMDPQQLTGHVALAMGILCAAIGIWAAVAPCTDFAVARK